MTPMARRPRSRSILGSTNFATIDAPSALVNRPFDPAHKGNSPTNADAARHCPGIEPGLRRIAALTRTAEQHVLLPDVAWRELRERRRPDPCPITLDAVGVMIRE